MSNIKRKIIISLTINKAKKMIHEIVREYNLNTPLFMLANKHKLSIPEVINILHKFVVDKNDN